MRHSHPVRAIRADTPDPPQDFFEEDRNRTRWPYSHRDGRPVAASRHSTQQNLNPSGLAWLQLAFRRLNRLAPEPINNPVKQGIWNTPAADFQEIGRFLPLQRRAEPHQLACFQQFADQMNPAKPNALAFDDGLQ